MISTSFASDVVFRFAPNGSPYDPAEPHAAAGGRFDNGVRLVLYVADSAEGAAAEFFRRHPELLALQDAATIRIYRFALTSHDAFVDVRDASGAEAAAIDPARLVSSEADPDVRYVECRDLADRAEPSHGGVAYPSAALGGVRANVVCFGTNGARWMALHDGEVPRPYIDPASVSTLP